MVVELKEVACFLGLHAVAIADVKVMVPDETSPIGVRSLVLLSYSHEDLAKLQKEGAALGQVWKFWNQKWQPGFEFDREVPEVTGWFCEWPRIREHKGVRTVSISGRPGIRQSKTTSHTQSDATTDVRIDA